MEWKAFTYQGEVYSLTHLHPFRMEVVQESKDGKPARRYELGVIFSLHCFTYKQPEDSEPEKELLYSDSRETRVFCFRRYELSKRLPEIIRAIADRKCYHTHHGNYFLIELIEEDTGAKVEYEVFFKISKPGKKKNVNLYIQSAYVRDTDHRSQQKKRKSIRFTILMHNTVQNKSIKIPQ